MPDKDAMMASAQALDDQFVAAFNRGDGAAVAALYADGPDTMNFPPDAMMVRGIGAIRDSSAKMFAAMPGAKIELVERHHVAMTDVVLGWGLWRMTMTGPDGAPMTMEGRYTDVKAQRDGKWVYLMDHASVPMPPPPAGGN
jgi:uncharacterized protein (TIGR02246 family)